jgi:hypothetical protein
MNCQGINTVRSIRTRVEDLLTDLMVTAWPSHSR